MSHRDVYIYISEKRENVFISIFSSRLAMQTTYQIKRPYTLWHPYRYTIKDAQQVCYRIHRFSSEKRRSFEDVNGNIIYYIGMKSLQLPNGQIVAQISPNGESISTINGRYQLTDIDLARGEYTLTFHDQIIARVHKKRSFTSERTTIELMNIHEQQLQFLFALFILIDKFYRVVGNPCFYFPIPHRPL